MQRAVWNSAQRTLWECQAQSLGLLRGHCTRHHEEGTSRAQIQRTLWECQTQSPGLVRGHCTRHHEEGTSRAQISTNVDELSSSVPHRLAMLSITQLSSLSCTRHALEPPLQLIDHRHRSSDDNFRASNWHSSDILHWRPSLRNTDG